MLFNGKHIGYFTKEEVPILLLFLSMTLGVIGETVGLILWLIYKNKIGRVFIIGKKLRYLYLYIFFCSLITITLIKYPYWRFFQQFILIFGYIQSYYVLLTDDSTDLNSIFEVYYKFSLIICLVALLQFILFHTIGFELNLTFNEEHFLDADKFRIKAWFGEPSAFCCYILPATVYSIIKYGLLKKSSLLLIISGFLAFSPVYYVFFGIFLFYQFVYKKWKVLALLSVMIICVVCSPVFSKVTLSNNSADDALSKVVETFELINEVDIDILESANTSTYALLKNFRIAMMAESRLFGTGVGTHGYSHDKYYQSDFEYAQLNSQDAYSLGIRLFSELGFLGIFAFLWFIFKGRNKNNIINRASLYFILYSLLRGGHYTIYGLQFFIMAYFFTSKLNKHEINNSDTCA